MPNPYFDVVDVQVLDDWKLKLRFEDGSIKLFDFKPLLSEKLYAPLRNPGLFKQAEILCGGLAWTDEIDIAPEYLYEHGVDAHNGCSWT